MPTKKPAKKVDTKIAVRSDGWVNSLTGVGDLLRDKSQSTAFQADWRPENREIQEDLWEADDMVARIIEVIPDEMMRAGFEITINDEATDTSTSDPAEDDSTEKPGAKRTDAFPPGGATKPGAVVVTPPPKPPGVIEPKNEKGRENADAVMARFEELSGPDSMLVGLQYDRAYGGAAIILGADDGGKPTTELKLDKIKSFTWMNVLTPREIWAVKYYSDPKKPKYGKPEIYQVQAEATVNSSSMASPSVPQLVTEIHESRVVVFPGIITSSRRRQARRGWGNSVLMRVMRVVSDFQSAYGSAAILLTDFAQAVFKIKGLAEIVSGTEDDILSKRVEAIQMARSVARMVMIDSEEELERKATPVTGLPELLDKFGERLAAAADMPLTRLMGRSPGGLGSNGEQEVRFFYDRIRTRQNRDLKPRIMRILRLIMLAKDGPTAGVEPEDWTIEFSPLWEPTEKEQAEQRKLTADTDIAYIGAQVVTPEEVAASRFGGARYSTETVIDFEARRKMAVEHEEELIAHEEEQGEEQVKGEDREMFERELATKELDVKAKAVTAKAKRPAKK